MVPDGTECLIITFLIAFLVSLYTAVYIRTEDEDTEPILGVNNNVFSSLIILVIDFMALCLLGLRNQPIVNCIVVGLLFIMFALIMPFCLGLAFREKLEGIYKVGSTVTGVLSVTITRIVILPSYLIFRLFRLDADDEVTQEDVMDMVEDADEDEIDDDQKEMIENIFELDETTAGDIMTHRTEVLAFSGKEKCRDILNTAIESGFSRIPVYDGTIDTIVGFIYAKDLLSIVGDARKMDMPIRRFIRKRMYVPERCAARELLVQFKKKHTQIAVVVDEYGGTSGIVTMEDILEEIVGSIQDEYDNEEELYVANEDGSYTVQASMELDDFLELFDIERTEEEEDEDDFDSVGGLIISKLERIPSQDEQPIVEYRDLLFTVLKVEDRRIVKVRAERVQQTETEE